MPIMTGGNLIAMSRVARRAAAAFLLTAFLAASAHAERSKPDTSRPTKIGVFLNSIFDINPSRNSYVADIYIWSLSPATGPDPLAHVTFPRAKSQTIIEQWSEIYQDTLWSVRRFRCDMNKEWDLGDYPFDLHIVNILIGTYAGAATLPPLEVDTVDSGAVMLACLMKTIHPPIFSGRMGLQIACLFSVIINHRSTNSSLGRDDVFCLLDSLHLIIYALLFAAILITLRSRMLNDRSEEKQATRWERPMTLVLVALFATANLLFIPTAILTPPHEDELSHAFRITK